MRRTISIIVLSVLSVALAQTAASAQADFYRGKTVTMVIGARLTGTLAIAALSVSHHIGKHIPGNPTVILRQMPGGAHLNATNYVFNVADADGLTVLAANPAGRDGAALQGAGGALRRAASSSGSARPALTACAVRDPSRPALQDLQGPSEREGDWSSAPPDPARTPMTCRCC